jgi:hypothetical protein
MRYGGASLFIVMHHPLFACRSKKENFLHKIGGRIIAKKVTDWSVIAIGGCNNKMLLRHNRRNSEQQGCPGETIMATLRHLAAIS